MHNASRAHTGVTITPGDSNLQYAAVRQMTFDERLPRVSPEPKAAIALNFPELKLVDVVDCGVPPGDSFRNPLTNVTKL